MQETHKIVNDLHNSYKMGFDIQDRDKIGSTVHDMQ